MPFVQCWALDSAWAYFEPLRTLVAGPAWAEGTTLESAQVRAYPWPWTKRGSQTLVPLFDEPAIKDPPVVSMVDSDSKHQHVHREDRQAHQCDDGDGDGPVQLVMALQCSAFASVYQQLL